MLRAFLRHNIRKVQDLSSLWNFQTNMSSEVYQLPVPGCWESHPDFVNFRGVGNYYKKIELTTNTQNVRLVFKGVSHTADIFFDEQKIGHHYNAYTPFSCVISQVAQGEHKLRVKVDNRFNKSSALHIPNDYYTYGGITRGVELQIVPDVYLERVLFTPEKTSAGWTANVRIVIKNIAERKQCFDLHLFLNSTSFKQQNLLIEPNTTITIEQELVFENVNEWTMDEPHLYLFKTELLQDEKVIDDLIERVGFRSVAIQGQELLVNEQSVFLKDFNRHEDEANFGCALPFQSIVRDLHMLKDLGANAIRTCHYPNDELFLDLCDEMGFLIWEENHARGLTLSKIQNPNFDQQCLDCNQEMVNNHYNHPSIIIWGLLNECSSETEEGFEKYQQQFQQIRKLDKSRPVTSATCKHFKDICLGLSDIVSFNMYTEWYQEMSILERHEQELKWINETEGAGKPIIISEFGAGGIYNYRSPDHRKWTEERQVDILKNNLEVYLNDKRLMGIFIWQFADCKVTEEENWFAVRPRSHNNKGIVDEYRRPKLAYEIVKKYYQSMK